MRIGLNSLRLQILSLFPENAHLETKRSKEKARVRASETSEMNGKEPMGEDLF
jgi:hypothetical protein